MIKIDSIILDVDGTLWDSVEVCARAWNKVISENSDLPANITGEKLKKLFGKPMDIIFNTLFPGQPSQEVERLSSLCVTIENEMLKEDPGIPYPEVVTTLKELKKKVPLFIVSNCQSGYIEACMEALQIEDLITGTACYGDNKVSKGQNILSVIEKYQLKFPVYVGDTQGDADASKEANIPFIHAAYGFGSSNHAAFRIHKISDLLELFHEVSFPEE